MRVEAQFDPSLVQKYNRSGPRYTSYPTALEFHPGFDEASYREAARASNGNGRPLSLYFHIPFCDTLCYFCGCNKVISNNPERIARYVQDLVAEVALHAPLYDRSRTVDQLHWGGGTPTSLSHEGMRAVMDAARRHFNLHADDSGEYSIEVDPRGVSAETVNVLRSLGFNRMSLGVQDFDPDVQKAVNRIQSLAETRLVIDSARACGFRGINVDLIYGLPFQSVASFADTLRQVIDLNPDRLAVFNYAHLPSRFRAQRMLKAEDMPAPEVKLQMLALTAETLTQAGYALVGMDHYARAEDELVRAQSDGTLYRNFQGYSIHRACDMVGMGVSAISMVNDTYAQNHKELPHYAEGVRAGHIPVHAGYAMTRDDIIRRECITEIMCNFVLPYPRMEALFGIRFADYFADDLVRLQSLQDDGLIRISADSIEVLPRGVPLIRHVAMAFDAYLHKQDANRFSKVI